jgi:hypothetical protein
MPSDVIRGWAPVRVKKASKRESGASVLKQSEPIML